MPDTAGKLLSLQMSKALRQFTCKESLRFILHPGGALHLYMALRVTDSGKGVCVDPGEREAILGMGGPGPLEKGRGQQLAPDSGGEGK
jgi:hypothetical protein